MQKICGSVLRVSEKVREALANNRPVVALQSTIISHGMPYPQNKQCALSIEKTILDGGAVPATIAIFEGKMHVGLSQSQIELLARTGREVNKVSRRDLPTIIARKGIGATTVSGTMIGAHAAGIDIFVTGGIGGVHRGFEQVMDVSADLQELGRTPVTVVSAGVKSILDIPRTLQYLETKGIPVMSFKSKYFPAFFSSSSGLLSPSVIQSEREGAEVIYSHQKLGLENGLLIAVPNPDSEEGEMIESAIQRALKEADQKHIKGAEITPFLLGRVNEITKGRSLQSNISLVHNNAKVGASIAKQLSQITVERMKAAQKLFTMGSESKPGKMIVIGGAAIDYQFVSEQGRKFQLYKSCMGHSKKTLGGVARNIADCAARLGIETILITALGNDTDATLISDFCKRNNIEVFSVTPAQNVQNSAKYIAILDESRNELLGISEMQINDQITYKNIGQKYLDKIGANDTVVVDCNLQEQELASLLSQLRDRRCFLVFQAKGQKTKRIINSQSYRHFHLIKMNKLQQKQLNEAIKLKHPNVTDYNKWLGENVSKDNPHSPTDIKCIITDGSNPIQLIRYQNQQTIVEKLNVPKPTKIQKTTGAGDSFTATFCTMLLRGKSQAQALLYARAASKLNIESEAEQSVISSQMSMKKLQKIIKQELIDL